VRSARDRRAGAGPVFRAHRDEFDTIFIGTSRIYHGLSPKLWDETMREAGHVTHTFNLAIDAMWPRESFQMVRRVLRMKPQKLHWLFLEVSDERETHAVSV